MCLGKYTNNYSLYKTHTHIYTFWAFSKGEERQSGWWVLCVNKEKKIKKKKKNQEK